ncbi:MAG: tryptophan synthase subunit alpha, partial [Gammaproteobacteria bacterium]|nr:tryptophan synthase subunit alpha [Gammaproteobacteria bacterium]
MSRISTRFAELRKAGETALIPFLTAGDPRPEATVRLMHTLVDAGAHVIELGVPFSDPMADGPVIQRANERALHWHTSLRDVLAMVGEFRETDTTTPVVLMGYLNPIETMGNEEFARAAALAGVDGTIIVDMPPEEGSHLLKALQANGIDPIFLLAPTTTVERMQSICDTASGFLYYVSL